MAELAREGAWILLPGRSLDELHVLATSIHEAGGRPTIVYCDLASETDRGQLVSYTMRLYHRLDVLVTELGAVTDSVATREGAWRAIDAEFSTMLDLVLLALPHMQRRGSIVNISPVGSPDAAEAGCAYLAASFSCVRSAAPFAAMCVTNRSKSRPPIDHLRRDSGRRVRRPGGGSRRWMRTT